MIVRRHINKLNKPILLGTVFLLGCAAVNEWPAADLLRPYLVEYIAATENEFVYDADGNFVGPSPHWRRSEKLFYEILRDQSADGDEAVAYLLFLYTGEHFGGELVCEASRRGARMATIIEGYRDFLPQTGLEPYPDALKGSGILVPEALKLIENGESCYH